MSVTALVGSLAGPLFGLIDDLFTSDEERAEAKQRLVEMESKGELEKIKGQLAINLKEAQSESLFVSGWRPAVGWICAAAFAYTFIIQPFGVFVAVVSGVDMNVINSLPDLAIDTMMPVLLGMLGLGGMRSFEKYKRANKNR